MFRAESNVKVGLSKFCSMVQEVVLTSERGQEVCMCEYHENIKMRLDGLRKSVPLLPKGTSEILEKMVCSMADKKCIDQQCEKCGVPKLDEYFEDIDDGMEVSYRRWMKSNVVKKELIVTDIAEAKQDLYLKHLVAMCIM